MCNPVIAAGLFIAQTAASIVTEVKSAKANEKAIREQLVVAEKEVNDKATAEVNDRQRAARREQARIRVAAGQGGLQLGGSIETLLQDSLMQSGLAEERLNDNRTNELANVRSEANSMLSRIERPTILGAGLRLATAGMQGYSAGQSLKIQRANAATNAAKGG
jgi:hypothetical protein